MNTSWTQLTLDRRSPAYWRVTFDHPPINTITAKTIVELSQLVDLIERDSQLNVVVFDSANPDFFLAHYDIEKDPAKTAALPSGPTGLPGWLDVTVRLSRAPVVSIASIRGRARGAGSEFILACDLRFASRENSVSGQFEVGAGFVPGGGPMARLSRLVGRGRALEILLVGDDFDGAPAEQYGYVNRTISDNELDAEWRRWRCDWRPSIVMRSHEPRRTSIGRRCPRTASFRRRCRTSVRRSDSQAPWLDWPGWRNSD
jgi:enoyl-CoA hydratase/carnithine racemase